MQQNKHKRTCIINTDKTSTPLHSPLHDLNILISGTQTNSGQDKNIAKEQHR